MHGFWVKKSITNYSYEIKYKLSMIKYLPITGRKIQQDSNILIFLDYNKIIFIIYYILT